MRQINLKCYKLALLLFFDWSNISLKIEIADRRRKKQHTSYVLTHSSIKTNIVHATIGI